MMKKIKAFFILLMFTASGVQAMQLYPSPRYGDQVIMQLAPRAITRGAVTELIMPRLLFPVISRMGLSAGFAGFSLLLLNRGIDGLAYSRPEHRDREFYYRTGIFFVGFLVSAGLAGPDVSPDLCPAFNPEKDKENKQYEEPLPDGRFIPQPIEFYAEDCQQLDDELFIHACTYHQYLTMKYHQLPTEHKGINSTSVNTPHSAGNSIQPEENEAVFLMISSSGSNKFIETDSASITTSPSMLYVIQGPVHSYFISTDPVNRVSLCQTGTI